MNKNKLILNINGMTLVEALLTIIVLGVVMLIVTSMIIQSYNVFENTSERLTKNRLVEIMLQDIKNHIRTATNKDNYNKSEILNASGQKIGELYSFQSFPNNNTTKINYEIKHLNEDKLIFYENNKVIREINNVLKFNITRKGYLFYIKIIFSDESNNEKEKTLTIFARNFMSVDD
jgi:competence protein ComGC